VPVGCSRPHQASLTDNTRYTDRFLGINGGPFLPSDNPAPKAVSVALLLFSFALSLLFARRTALVFPIAT
jgi:hypothetical protein